MNTIPNLKKRNFKNKFIVEKTIEHSLETYNKKFITNVHLKVVTVCLKETIHKYLQNLQNSSFCYN